MEDYIYEKDYSYKNEIEDTVDYEDDTDFDDEDFFASDSVREAFKLYADFMRKLPKVVIQKDKETFERLVPKLDEFARYNHGSIKAVVDYNRWEAYIYLTQTFFEICTPEDAELFADIAQNTNSFCFQPTDDKKVRLSIYIHYFEEVMF